MLYYLSKSVHILQDWDLAGQLQEQSNQCKIFAIFNQFFHCPGKNPFCCGKNPTLAGIP